MPIGNYKEYILVMGQSNIDARIPAPNPLVDGSNALVDIEVYNPDTNLMAPWVQGVNVGADTSTDARWAFDSYVLTLWRDYTGVPQSVIKTTKGGTSIKPVNSSGTWHTVLDEITPAYAKMYFRLISKVERVRAIDARNGIISKFPIVIWHQGESDIAEHAAYQAGMETLIRKVRELTWTPEQHWFSGSIPTNSNLYSVNIYNANVAVAAGDPLYHFIDLGTGTFSDGVHFNAAYAETVGNLYHDRMILELT